MKRRLSVLAVAALSLAGLGRQAAAADAAPAAGGGDGIEEGLRCDRDKPVRSSTAVAGVRG